MIKMSKWAIITIILLLAGIGLAYSSCNVTGAMGNSSCIGNETGLANCTSNQNYTCIYRENCTNICKCLDNQTCIQNGCTYENCTCPYSGALNNSSNMSCTRNGPCPINGKFNLNSLETGKKGKIYTMTVSCGRC
jgi:hypothetical protein